MAWKTGKGGSAMLCLFLGIQMSLAQKEEVAFRWAGDSVTFTCDKKITHWDKDGQTVYRFQHPSTILRGSHPDISDLQKRSRPTTQVNQEKHIIQVSSLLLSDTGVYRCLGHGTEHETVQLVVFQVTPANYQTLLVSDDLELRLSFKALWDVDIICKDPKNNVRGTWKAQQGQDLKVKALQPQDHGTWTCQISGGKASLELRYEVTMAGFLPGPTTIYSRINDTVPLPCVFTFNIRGKPFNERLEVKGGGLYRSDDKDMLGQAQRLLNISKDGVCWSNACGEPPAAGPSDLSLSLPRVQFHDGGWYTVLVKFPRKELKRTFHLSVLRVSAFPAGPVAPASQVDLICEVSSHSSETVLKWTQVNSSTEDDHLVRGAGSFRITLSMFPVRFGLWRCSLYNGENLLQSADFNIEEKRLSSFSDWRVWALCGIIALALLLLLVCAVVCVARCRRLRRRASRMAWLKQQRTCQCKDQVNLLLRQ
ncbi:T-cell surface glycoprotein CD4 [Ambystoma mexicanum]|uniref:T-cell surface glycoprotein CD4 n=1 Tax=Ambystoma mexicanum TaxID=8296 RepID=UPI0037E91AAC